IDRALAILINYSRCFFFQAEDGIRDRNVTGVQTCALPIYLFEQNDADNGGIKYCRIEKNRNVSSWCKLIGKRNPELTKCCKHACQKQKDKLLPRHWFIKDD